MENKTNWWLIIAIVIIVAVLASLITISLTGNTIRQTNNLLGKYEIYTKAEVDSLLSAQKQDLTAVKIERCSMAFQLFDGGVSTGGFGWADFKLKAYFKSLNNDQAISLSINDLAPRTLSQTNPSTIVDGMTFTFKGISKEVAIVTVNAC
jgi:hypothetical protein